MKSLAFAGALSLALLSGCSNLAQLTVDDTQQAIDIAQAVNDQPAVQCFTGFNQLAKAAGGTVVMAPAGSSATATAIATKIEVARGVKQVLTTDCGDLTGDFLSNVLHGVSGPFAGLLP
jgi:hypothetical protein